jgi:hypothetical protein
VKAGKYFFLLFIFAAAQVSFSVQLEDIIDSERAAILRSSGGSITETRLKNPALELLPRYAPLQKFVSEIQEALKPSLSVETLRLYKKPARQDGWSDAQRAGLFNRITALSTLTGIQYYSASRGAMRVFYESSLVINGPVSKMPLPNPVFASPPESLSLYARQKDLTFGDNVYRYDYRTTQDAFFFAQENMTALNAGIIPAVGKNKLRSVFAVIDSGDCLLIYAVSMAKTASIPGMGDRIGNSFGNRAEAAIKWFADGADEVFTGAD